MKDRGIIFKPENVRAIRESRKTQTRRVIKNPDNFVVEDGCEWPRKVHSTQPLLCPYGMPGDTLWVRETHCIRWVDHATGQPLRSDGRLNAGAIGKQQIIYRADYDTDEEWSQACGERQRRSPMFMPRWASRLTLELTEVRVESVQDITNADALAEGINLDSPPARPSRFDCAGRVVTVPDHRMRYFWLWESINGKRDGGIYSWAKNPWVWVLEFRVIDCRPPGGRIMSKPFSSMPITHTDIEEP